MNPSGLVVIIASVWVAFQVLGGDALQRLGILPGGNTGDDAGSVPAPNIDPDTRVPNQDPSKPPLTDGQGRVF